MTSSKPGAGPLFLAAFHDRSAVRGPERASRDILWLQNKGSCWYNHAFPRPARQVDAFSLTAEGLRDGKCSVAWWETWKGTLQQRERSTVKDGRWLLKIPGLETDVAIKIKMIDDDLHQTAFWRMGIHVEI